MYIHFYLLKLPACDLERPISSTDQHWIWNVTLPSNFVSPWLFMLVMAGSLQINMHTKPTLSVTIQRKFQYGSTKSWLLTFGSTLKCMVGQLQSFMAHIWYVIVITHPWGLYLSCKRNARGRRVYKSDTNLMDVLQLLCFMVCERIKGVLSLCLAWRTILYCWSHATE